jgi:NDP-hexose-3-ketoreductase
MKIGVIGAASIFKNRWLNILTDHPEVKLVGVARRDIDNKELNFDQRQGYFSFDAQEVDWVYVPLPNNFHFEVAKYYLSKGVNVLVEKPSAVTIQDTIELVKIAEENNVQLIEAFQWRYHRRTKWLKENLDEIDPYLIDVVFTIPHLENNNIRYQKSLHGGAVYDLGAYPCSVLSTLFDKDEFQLVSFNSWNNNDNVDMGGAGVFETTNRRLNFYYSFGKSYESRLTLHGMKGRYDMNQPFTAPSNKEVIISREFNTVNTQESFSDCHFNALLNRLINHNNYDIEKSHQEVLLQAKYLNQLIEAKNENTIC